ncbi:MAG TPA: hypothetical protein DEP84_16405, partial [Chloroflexi bacterium]|nr:hypothetical protein [Chloroflexota bacterium]
GGASLAEPRLAEPADPYAGVLALQRAAGNRAVTRLLQGHTATRPPRGKSLSTLVRSALKRDGGHPLDPVTRAVMESRFRHEFSAVRLHTGAPAAKTAQTLHARAFAVGQDLFFAPGEFRPATAEGQKLLAHELAHVIQQRGASGAPRAQLDLGARGDRYEREAEVASQ